MKAYLSIKYHPDNRNRETIEQISQILTTCGFETICIRRDVEHWGTVMLSPHELMTATFDAIRSCQIIVVDLSEKGVGLGIEAGYAYAHSIPVFTIARQDCEISPTLHGLSTAIGFYRTPKDLFQCFVELGLFSQDDLHLA